MTESIVEDLLRRGLSWDAYLDLVDRAAAVDPEGLEGIAAERAGFSKLNRHRTARILRTWRPSDELAALLARRTEPETWLALTEPWCGDSAQCLPMIVIMADRAPGVTLRLLLRDDNPEVMDRYLTDGKRGIPLVVAFDPADRELFRWGPRPGPAQAVFEVALAAGLDRPARLEKLHLFYGRDRGRSLEAEWVALLGRLSGGSS